MFKHSLVSMVAVAPFAFANLAVPSLSDPAVYFEAGQYSAALEQGAHRWHLTPLQGDRVDVIESAEDCAVATHIPSGLWIVTRDGDGRAQLVAPSSTALPHGFPAQLALRHCGEAVDAKPALKVSAVVFDWISANAGSVRIDD